MIKSYLYDDLIGRYDLWSLFSLNLRLLSTIYNYTLYQERWVWKSLAWLKCIFRTILFYLYLICMRILDCYDNNWEVNSNILTILAAADLRISQDVRWCFCGCQAMLWFIIIKYICCATVTAVTTRYKYI